MIVRQQIRGLELEPGDVVVAMTPWRDWLMVVTARGKLFQVLRERHDD